MTEGDVCLSFNGLSALKRKGVHLLQMTISAYCDANGKNVANTTSRFLTLGVYFGTEKSWPQLERDWIAILSENEITDTSLVRRLIFRNP
jgi:hypothetical protein